MPKEVIIPESLQSTYDTLHYAPATRAGDMLYLSGVIATLQDGETGTDEEYTAASNRAFARIDMVLKEAGASMADIVDITSFHVGIAKHIYPLAAAKDEWLQEPYPCWTVIGTTELFEPNAFVEIKVTAYCPK